jgi:hypothetical protein
MDPSDLLKKFVRSFEKLDEMYVFKEIDEIAYSLRSGEQDELGRWRWRVEEAITEREYLDAVYAKLPAPFPPLYEQLVLSYRWAKVDLQSFSLLANPPGSDLSGLRAQISHDKGLWDSLIPAGYIQFGSGPDMDYDPVCFELKSRTNKKDYRIVKIDHEQILCNWRVKVVAEVAPNFEQLVLQTIERANDVK